VEDCEETNLGAHVFWVGRDTSQSLAGGAKEDVVDHLLILEREVSELVGYGEHHVKVVDRQKVRLLLGEPLGFGQRLAVGAMAIAAGVIRDTCIPAPIALIAVPAKPSGAALLDGTHHSELLR
jgi:hypothetical protein